MMQKRYLQHVEGAAGVLHRLLEDLPLQIEFTNDIELMKKKAKQGYR